MKRRGLFDMFDLLALFALFALGEPQDQPKSDTKRKTDSKSLLCEEKIGAHG